MNETPDPQPTEAAPGTPPENSFFASLRRVGLARPADRWVGGVSGAIARKLGIDPLIVRGLFVASVFFAGIGLVLFGIGWALLPEESDGRIHAQELARGNSDVALLGAAGFVLAGLIAGDGRWTLAAWWNAAGLGWINGLLWLAVVGVVVAIIVTSSRASGNSPSAPASPHSPPPYQAPPPSPTPSPSVPYAPPPTASFTSETPMSTTSTTPHTAYVPPVPPVPPTPPIKPAKPSVPGAGARAFAVCAGLSLIAFAGLLLAERAGFFTGPLALTTLGLVAVIFGLGIVVAGLRGRTTGALGFIAVLSIFLSFPVAATADVDLAPWRHVERWQGLGSSTHTPESIGDTEGGFAVGVGDVRVDLTELDVPTGEVVDLAVQAGMGSVAVVLPGDASARLVMNVGAGEVTWDVDGADGDASGFGVQRTVTNAGYTSGEDPTFTIHVNVGVGNVDITQES